MTFFVFVLGVFAFHEREIQIINPLSDFLMALAERHWVEDLFPPHFTVTVPELSEKPKEAEEGSQEAWRIRQRRKVKDIYEQVRDRLEAEAHIPKDKNIQVGEPLGEAKHRSKLEGHVTRLESSRRQESSGGIGAEERIISARRKGGSGAGVIWSAEEIQILRSESQRIKEERLVLQIELKTLEEDYQNLREKYRHQETALNARNAELKKSRQENVRLCLQSEHLAKDVRLQKSKLAMAEDDYREVLEQRLSLRKEMVELRKSLVGAKQEAQELSIKLSESDTKHRLETMEREEAMKLDYESQIARLYQELAETRQELEKEQKEHKRSSKALDLLRIHFAQQSMRSEPVPDSSASQKRGSLKVLQLF